MANSTVDPSISANWLVVWENHCKDLWSKSFSLLLHFEKFLPNTNRSKITLIHVEWLISFPLNHLWKRLLEAHRKYSSWNARQSNGCKSMANFSSNRRIWIRFLVFYKSPTGIKQKSTQYHDIRIENHNIQNSMFSLENMNSAWMKWNCWCRRCGYN